MKKENRQLGFWAFLPLLTFLLLYIGTGVVVTITQGADGAFGSFPRHVALLFGFAVALLLKPSIPVAKKFDCMCQSMGNSGVMAVVMIYLMAGGFQNAAAAVGGKTSVVNLCLNYVPAGALIPGIFVMCCLISTSLGTSMGTIGAMAPVAIGVASGAGLNPAIAAAAVIGGAYFGDNLSMISDTTISAAQGVGSEMRDKFKVNLFIALPAAIVSMILYAIVGGSSAEQVTVGDFNLLQVLPYVLVLVIALIGVNVSVVLFLGIISTGIIGLAQGSVTFLGWIGAVADGMSDMMGLSIAAILISGIIGLVRLFGGIDWLLSKVGSKISTKKGAEFGVGIMSGILSGALVNNTLAIITTAPIAKEFDEKYGIQPKHMASIIDIFACAVLALMPHDGGVLMATEFAGCSPLEMLQFSFYPVLLLVTMCLTIALNLFERKGKSAATNK
jgi:Na+/H+ antiporter NhaC